MRKSFLSSIFELLGFVTVALLFFVWFMGNRGNDLIPSMERHESGALQSMAGDDDYRDSAGELKGYGMDDPGYADTRSRSSRNDYGKSALRKPDPVATERYISSGATDRETTSERSGSSSRVADLPVAEEIRNWKGVHRDEAFALGCYERFGDEVIRLSEEYGLYPQVLMARVIAYSYDYVTYPEQDPADHNFTGLKRPGGDRRAHFKNAEESLKAYAVVNAGEVNQLSAEGAVAKHDRAWTLTKIIDNYSFISNLPSAVASNNRYRGSVGPANDVSEEENYERELVGETIRLTTRVDSKIKEKTAKDAGYDNWEDYINELPEGQRERQLKETNAVTSAVLQKKSMNLTRRVNAKKRSKNEGVSEVVVNQNKK